MKIRGALIALAVSSQIADAAFAADLAVPKPAKDVSVNPWNGFYFGGHVGFVTGQTSWSQAPGLTGTSTIIGQDSEFGPGFGGLEIGFNHVLPSGILVGVNTDVSFPDLLSADPTFNTGAAGPVARRDSVEIFGTLRGKLGYTAGPWLIYGQAGFAYDRDLIEDSYGDADSGNTDDVYFWRPGWTIGAGVEAKLDANWSAKLEYDYMNFAHAGTFLPVAGQAYRSDLHLHQIIFGLNYRFDLDKIGQDDKEAKGGKDDKDDKKDKDKGPSFGIVHDLDERWSLHGQSTLIGQGDAPFHSPYAGPNSLHSNGEVRDSLSITGFLGLKIADGTELYFNPEPFQGHGLSQTHGLAGFPNGEAQKAGFNYPHYNTSRLFMRQTFGLGGEQEDLEDAPNQVGEKVDISRLTFQFGKMATTDIFDNNTYTHDPRTSFMNLSFVDGGAFDYAADQKGYTFGLTGELNQKDWAVRAGYFLVPDSPNSNELDTRLGRRGQYVGEFEDRYSLFSKTGKLRLTAWLAESFTGSFSETLNEPYLNPLTAPSDSPGIAATRRTRSEFGFVANVEQPITDDIGIFSRLSWRNGQTEIVSFTDIDRSASIGVQTKGTAWDRSDDKVGVAFAVNGLSNSYRAFLAAGGLGLDIGDGRLTYQTEKVFETYYAYSLTKWATLSFDYQFIADPAYNADRGPVNIGSVRLHFEF